MAKSRKSWQEKYHSLLADTKKWGYRKRKIPGGVEAQKRLLEREGHKIVPKGKKSVVVDFDKHLVKL